MDACVRVCAYLCAPASCDELQLGTLELLQPHFYRIKSVTTVLNFIRRGFMFSGVLPSFLTWVCGCSVHVHTVMWFERACLNIHELVCARVCDLLRVGTCVRIHAFIALLKCQSASQV